MYRLILALLHSVVEFPSVGDSTFFILISVLCLSGYIGLN